jgi:hypothetical protein
MSNLKLITTENFGELQCNFYRNMNDDILLTREQIGTAWNMRIRQKQYARFILNTKTDWNHCV